MTYEYDTIKKAYEELIKNQITTPYAKTIIDEENNITILDNIVEELSIILDVIDGATLPTIISTSGKHALFKNITSNTNSKVDYNIVFHSLIVEFNLLLSLHGISSKTIINCINSFNVVNANSYIDRVYKENYSNSIKRKETYNENDNEDLMIGIIILMKHFTRFGKTLLYTIVGDLTKGQEENEQK